MPIHLPAEHPDVKFLAVGGPHSFRLCVRDEHWIASTTYKVTDPGFVTNKQRFSIARYSREIPLYYEEVYSIGFLKVK